MPPLPHAAVFRSRFHLADDNPHLLNLLRSRSERGRKAEIEELIAAIEKAKANYWQRVKEQLDERRPPYIDDPIVSGGGALFFQNELISYFKEDGQIYWGGIELQEFLNEEFGKEENGQDGLFARLADAYSQFVAYRDEKLAALREKYGDRQLAEVGNG